MPHQPSLEDLSPGGAVVCVDVGSTFTKAAAIGLDGAILATGQHPTTFGTDVLAGVDSAVAGLGVAGVPDTSIIVCSSAGGGLRLAVVGHERVISAEAGRRVALSAGARVVALSAGLLDDAGIAELAGARPDVLLVVGGTDGGDTEVLLHNARVLGRSRLRVPVVLAGNVDAAAAAAALLGAGRRVVRTTDNVIPRIGVLHPGPARRAIREVFIAHVIGGKGLSRGPRFAGLVVCATPDAVLAGLEVVAEVLASQPGASGDVMALDIGGATTDVYSVLTPDDQATDDSVETLWHGRSVEGDLGMRWSAQDVIVAAVAERLLESGEGGSEGASLVGTSADRSTGGTRTGGTRTGDTSVVGTSPVDRTLLGTSAGGASPVGTTPVGTTPVGTTPVGTGPVGTGPVGTGPVGRNAGAFVGTSAGGGGGSGGARGGGRERVDELALAAEIRRSDVGFLPRTEVEEVQDLVLARLAAVIAARRHARPGFEGSRDLTHVGLVIGSGGVLRHAAPAAARGVLDAVLTDFAGGWRLPVRSRVIIDRLYLLAPIGLLEMTGRPAAARALAEQLTTVD